MKQLRAVLLLLALPLIISACGKKTVDPPASTANFTVSGVRNVDLSVTSTGSYSFPISVTPVGSGKDTVFLYANDLPSGLIFVSFSPIKGIPPFTSTVTVSGVYTQGGGSFTVNINCSGSSGLRSYPVVVTLPKFRGWQLGTDVYNKTSVEKAPGNGTTTPVIKATASNNAQLFLKFAANAGLPLSNRSYNIASSVTGGGSSNMLIELYDGARTWQSTGGSGPGGTASPTGNFTFDALGKFTFKCENVEMISGTEKKTLECTFSE